MDRTKLLLLVTVAVAISAGMPSAARSDPTLQTSAGSVVVTEDEASSGLDGRPDFRASHRTSRELVQAVLRQRRNDPEWLVRETGVNPSDTLDRAAPRLRYVALQIDRLDGTDMLTVRQSLATIRNLHFFAGAGLGRAKYMGDDLLEKPLPRRRAHHSLGAAAEIGAHAQLAERVSVVAALRWIQLGRDATLLKSDYGTMNADAAMLGVTVGYRFR